MLSYRKIAIVAYFEFITTLLRRSVLFILFGLPLLSLLVLLGINWLASGQDFAGEVGEDAAAPSRLREFALGSEQEVSRPAGLVDKTGRIHDYPPPLDNLFWPQVSESSARAAFDAGELSGYYVIPPDYLETGSVYYYARSIAFRDLEQQMFITLLAANFIEDPAAGQRVITFPLVDEVNLSAREETAGSIGAAVALGIGFAILFYMTAMGAAGYLLQSLGKEKQNRVMEVLLSSLRPLELLTGKMLGLGGIGLLQMAIWTAIGLLVLGRGNSFFSNVTLPQLDPLAWFVIVAHFVAGYLVYASLFAGLGAITPGPKESSQYTFLFMLPTFLPLWFNGIIFASPQGSFALGMSLFPLTAPIAMPMRLAITAVPAWQWLLSLALALLTAAAALFLATRIFRSQALLSGQSLSWRAIGRALSS